MRFSSCTSVDGVLTRSFTCAGVPGVLWSPATGCGPLVLSGHPGGLHKTAPGVVARARYLAAAGFHVAAIDAPGHGDRPRPPEDAASVERLLAARAAGLPLGPVVSSFNASIAERAVPEWRATLDLLLELSEVAADRPVGYIGMTLATEIGLRLLVDEPRIGAAVLGGAFASPSLVEVAGRVRVPVQYLLAWNDPEIDRESSFALFDALGSPEKTLHANPGPHERVPWFETEDAVRFLRRHIVAT